jgi:hypothetical protein
VSKTTFGKWGKEEEIPYAKSQWNSTCYSSTYPKIDFYLTPQPSTQKFLHWVKIMRNRVSYVVAKK